MVNSLLSPTSIRLFGQKVTDLTINAYDDPANLFDVKASANTDVNTAAPVHVIDGISITPGDYVLLMSQAADGDNGRYIRGDANKLTGKSYDPDALYNVLEGDSDRAGKIFQGTDPISGIFNEVQPNFAVSKTGRNQQLVTQLTAGDGMTPVFARIYGFSYDGLYHELTRPTNFLVHNDGVPISSSDFGSVLSRSPRDPEQTGIGAADFQIAGRIRVWTYDKADFTVRMDLDGGMFEEVLLGFEFGGGDDPDGDGSVGGGRVGGGRVGGGRVGGGRVGGGRVGGGRVGGGRVGGGRVGGGRVGGG